MTKRFVEISPDEKYEGEEFFVIKVSHNKFKKWLLKLWFSCWKKEVVAEDY